MLIEIYSPAFKENNNIRPVIQFKKGLNVIQGTQTGSNSIGKSSALLAIDFAFGGNSYLDSDGVKYVGNHVMYFCFKFDKKYFFSRSTADADTITVCNEKYKTTDKTLFRKEFIEWLKEKYVSNKTNLSFRQLTSTFFRIYGKNNHDENYPLQGYRNQPTKESIKILMSLFDFYKDIEPYHNQLDVQIDKLKTFKNARKYSFISNLVGGKTQYEENIKTLSNLRAELNALTLNYEVNASSEEIESNKARENLKANKLSLDTQLERLQRQSKLLEISIEFGLLPTEADIESLAEFFPDINLKKIYEIEQFHKKLSAILEDQFKSEKESLDTKTAEIKDSIEQVERQMSELNITNSISKDFLDKHSELNKKIEALEEQNKAYLEETQLQEAKQSATQNLEKNVEHILSEIEYNLNTRMHEFNDRLYVEKRNSPKIELKNYNSYRFFTPKDTGTGTNFKGLILLDLAILYTSALPALVHDSLFFKNIDDEGIDGIMKIYKDTANLNKQIFIAFDKQSSYSNETYEILQDNKVLQLYSGGGELYGQSWNREIKGDKNEI